MTKKRFGLIGEVLVHSFSPRIHSLYGDYEYKLYELKRDELADFFEGCELDGFNVTIPYKSDVMKYCEHISDRALRIGSVNTVIKRSDGSFFGDNTDYFGFSTLLGDTRGGKAVILGSGGSSKTVKTVLEDRGFSPIVVISRSGEDNYDNISKHFDAELIVNTTPVGMYPNNGKSPISLRGFDKCKLVIDLIYNPARTALMLEAQSLGIETRGGLLMLASQGKLASELFTGKLLAPDADKAVADTLSREMQNIVLIGMPGCGKTSIGRVLAEKCGMNFYDTDEEISKECSSAPGEIIKRDGVESFRHIESMAVERLCKESRSVIATGGGVVTVDENFAQMHQNGTIVFLDRDIRELSVDGRPLSESLGVETLYSSRIDRYRTWSDITVTVHGVNETARDIMNMLDLREKR